jgi:hypothetical protein
MINLWDGIHVKMKRARMVIANSKLEYRERIRDDVYPQAVRFMFDPVSGSIKKRYHEKH